MESYSSNVAPTVWSGRAYLFITLKQPFQTKCQDPATLLKSWNQISLPLIPTFLELCGNGLNVWPQIPISSPFTKFDWVFKLLFRKKCKYRFRGPAQLSAVFISPLMYAKWSFWFKIISWNAKQCPHCCFCWLAVNQWDARLPPSEHLLYWKSISAGLAL